MLRTSVRWICPCTPERANSRGCPVARAPHRQQQLGPAARARGAYADAILSAYNVRTQLVEVQTSTAFEADHVSTTLRTPRDVATYSVGAFSFRTLRRTRFAKYTRAQISEVQPASFTARAQCNHFVQKERS